MKTTATESAPPTRFSAELVRVRRNPVLLFAAAAPAAASTVALALALAGVFPDWTLFPSFLGLALGALATNHFFERNVRPWVSVVTVETDDQHLHIGRRSIRRGRVQAALIVPGAASGLLLRIRFGLSVRLHATRTEALGLQAALGRDASHPVTFGALSWVLASTRRTLLWLLVVNGASFATKDVHVRGLWVAPGVFLASIALAFLPTRVRVSPAGVRIRWLGRGRHIDLDRVEDVGWFTDERANAVLALFQGWGTSGLRFLLEGGEEVLVPFALRALPLDFSADANKASLTVALAWQRIRDAARLRGGRHGKDARPENEPFGASLGPRTHGSHEEPG